MTYAEKFPNWVPDSLMGNRQDTATVVVGTARENGLVVRHHVASTQGGFYITDALADVLYDEDEEGTEPEPEPEPKGKGTKKTSGNRAAKNVSQEGE